MKKHGNEFVNSKKLNLMPIIALLIIAGLIWYIYDLKTDYKIEKSAPETDTNQPKEYDNRTDDDFFNNKTEPTPDTFDYDDF